MNRRCIFICFISTSPVEVKHGPSEARPWPCPKNGARSECDTGASQRVSSTCRVDGPSRVRRRRIEFAVGAEEIAPLEALWAHRPLRRRQVSLRTEERPTAIAIRWDRRGPEAVRHGVLRQRADELSQRTGDCTCPATAGPTNSLEPRPAAARSRPTAAPVTACPGRTGASSRNGCCQAARNRPADRAWKSISTRRQTRSPASL